VKISYPEPPLRGDTPSPYSLGSTGSLSSASTPNTHSCTRRSGSRRTNRSRASIPSANSRSARDRFVESPRDRSPFEVLRERVLRPVDDPQVLRPAALHGGLEETAPAAHGELERLHHHPFAAAAHRDLRALSLPPAGDTEVARARPLRTSTDANLCSPRHERRSPARRYASARA
jgi:hypothetical protein